MPVTSELRTLKMFLCSVAIFFIYKCSIGVLLAYAQRSSVVQDIFIKRIVLIVQDYCIAAHSGCVIKSVAPADVVCPTSYNLNEQAYQKRKRNKTPKNVLLYLYCLLRIYFLLSSA